MEKMITSLIIIIIIPLVIFIIGIYLGKVFEKARKIKCYYCNKQLGKDYTKDIARYQKRKNEDNWSHLKCIPKDKLKYWRKTH
jgi:hypothetical protein